MGQSRAGGARLAKTSSRTGQDICGARKKLPPGSLDSPKSPEKKATGIPGGTDLPRGWTRTGLY